MTTPAGTFDRCWRRFSPEEPDAFVILCRGIGPVIVASTANNNYLELTSLDF